MRFLLKQSSADISEFAVAILEQWEWSSRKEKNQIASFKNGRQTENYELIYLPTLPSQWRNGWKYTGVHNEHINPSYLTTAHDGYREEYIDGIYFDYCKGLFSLSAWQIYIRPAVCAHHEIAKMGMAKALTWKYLMLSYQFFNLSKTWSRWYFSVAGT